MLDLAPSTGPVPPPSAVDAVATGLGRTFVDAIVAGDFDRLETLLAPDVRFRAIIPDEYQEASTAAGARALIEDWFGGTDPGSCSARRSSLSATGWRSDTGSS